MTLPYIGRIAPSPTGLLHLGHAATFWTAHQRALAHNGALLFRNEDLDGDRSRPEFAAAMVEDLAWLGIRWMPPILHQSERLPLYREAMAKLLLAGAVYPCRCTRKDLLSMVHAPHEETDDEPVYRGHCRPVHARSHELLPGTNYRFRVPDEVLIHFTDGNLGPQAFRAGCTPAADFGDFLVWRKDGLPSYQLACVVDDAAMGITEVVRGLDLLKSTARQILLQRALLLGPPLLGPPLLGPPLPGPPPISAPLLGPPPLGSPLLGPPPLGSPLLGSPPLGPPPAYFHTPLLRDGNGRRLAKRHDALSLRFLRESGTTPEQIVAQLLPQHTFPPAPASQQGKESPE